MHEIPRYDGVVTRLLAPHERPFAIDERGVPLVIEPRHASGTAFLKSFLGANSRGVKEALDERGAILLRGFDVSSERDFEETVLSIEGLRGMRSYFMSERGRELVEGTRSVFYTNTLYKTGGGSHLGGFHSENYYSADVPSFQSFWCKREPELGGETALIQMAGVYSELGEGLRAKLERAPFSTKSWPLSEIAARYRLAEDAVEELFRGLGWSPVVDGGEKHLVLMKPSVYRHPRTRRLSLQINLSIEVRGLDAALQELFRPHYQGPKWALHRLAWRYPALGLVLLNLEHLPRAIARPDLILQQILAPAKAELRARRKRREKTKAAPVAQARLGDQLSAAEVDSLAKAIRKHCSVFTWKRGDVVLLDNLQMAHAGMPGYGPRELRVMICNPIPVEHPVTRGVLDVPDAGDGYESIDSRLQALARRAPQEA